MNRSASMHKGQRFPPAIIQHVVWLCHRFSVSFRDIEDLMAERGIAVSYESIRLWCIKFGNKYARRLRRRHQGYGDTFHLDEVFRNEPRCIVTDKRRSYGVAHRELVPDTIHVIRHNGSLALTLLSTIYSIWGGI